MATVVDKTRIGTSRVLGAAQGAANAGWFGDGRDGDLYVADGETLALDVALDEGQIVKQYKNGYIGTGSLLTAANRCNGMVLLFNGDLTVKGTISMDKKAPLANPMEEQCAAEVHVALCGCVGGDGGAGGNGASRSRSSSSSSWSSTMGGAGGSKGIGFQLGGGYGGGGGGSSSSAAGGSGEPRAPIGSSIPYPAGNGITLYGVGGSNDYANGGNGPGGSGCATQSATYATAGITGDAIGGGGIWIFVKGKLAIDSSGIITADGGNGANGVTRSGTGYSSSYTGGANFYSGGGGAAGGGIIAIVHNGDYANAGSIAASGGTGGIKGGNGDTGNIAENGSDGSIGTVLITTLADLLAK